MALDQEKFSRREFLFRRIPAVVVSSVPVVVVAAILASCDSFPSVPNSKKELKPTSVENGNEAVMFPVFLKQYLRTDRNQELWQYLSKPAQNVPYMSRDQSTPIIYERYAFDPKHTNIGSQNLPSQGDYDEIDYSLWYPQSSVTSNPDLSCNVIVDRSTRKVIYQEVEFGFGPDGELMKPLAGRGGSDYWLYNKQLSYREMEKDGTQMLKTVLTWKEVVAPDPVLLGMAERHIEGSLSTNISDTNVAIYSNTGVLISTLYK